MKKGAKTPASSAKKGGAGGASAVEKAAAAQLLELLALADLLVSPAIELDHQASQANANQATEGGGGHTGAAVAALVEAAAAQPSLRPLLTDWQLLARRLLDDGGSALSERQGVLLTLVFCRAAHVFCSPSSGASGTSGSPSGTRSGPASPKKGTLKKLWADGGAALHAEALSVHLVKALPVLLEKFQAEPLVAECLLPLAAHLQPKVLGLAPSKVPLQRLLQQLHKLLLDGPPQRAPAVCASLRCLLCDHSRRDDVVEALQEVCDRAHEAVTFQEHSSFKQPHQKKRAHEAYSLMARGESCSFFWSSSSFFVPFLLVATVVCPKKTSPVDFVAAACTCLFRWPSRWRRA